MNRRSFLQNTTSCSAHLAGLAAFGGSRQIFAQKTANKIVAEEKFARIEELAPGVFAIISTAFDTKDFTTVCNGGIVAGNTGTLVIEATMTTAGASWVSKQAEALTGRAPTDLIVTHFHGDHVDGHPAFTVAGSSPRTWISETTQKAAEENFAQADPVIPAFGNVQRLLKTTDTLIDLGGVLVSVLPKAGHTKSDVTIEISEPKVFWTGDLFFNRVFPNFTDSTPPLLDGFAADMLKYDERAVIVPGHGPLATRSDAIVYQDFLYAIESAAKSAHAAGTPAIEAADAYKLPGPFSEWVIWSPANMQKAFAAWYRELG